MSNIKAHVLRIAALLIVSTAALQLAFALRIGLMAWIDPRSTTFQRSEAWRLISTHGELRWRQQWVPGDRIAGHLYRAVIASEDAGFVGHSGIDWDAVEAAWERNQRAQARAERLNAARPPDRPVPVKVVGGSTISQQLAKNLFLSGERTVVRKGQEMVLTMMLEAMLSKHRILEIYLNSVEWGEGVFGAEAAARHHFRTEASRLSAPQAARLAVMLPAPRRFEKRPNSAYIASRTSTILARMGAVEVP